jgi:hypothetical protein
MGITISDAAVRPVPVQRRVQRKEPTVAVGSLFFSLAAEQFILRVLWPKPEILKSN